MISYSLEPKGDYLPLDGATLPSDTPVYIRVNDTGDIREVAFVLNGVEIRTEKSAPYSFGGTAAFRRPRPATLTTGPHVIKAGILRRDGFVHDESVSFRVGEEQPKPTGETRAHAVQITIGGMSKNLTLTTDADGNVTGLE